MEPDRRNFIKGAVLGTAPMFIPRSAWGANDRITYGSIAVGGRGRYLNTKFQSLGAQCAAVCDVYEPNVELALKQSPNAKSYVDYRQLLDKEKNLDAVVLAGPDHHHCPMLLASLAAGRDVYAEKPLSKTLEESATMVAAVRKSKQIVQIGMQRRSAESLIKAKKLVDDGVLGRITLVKPQWHWNIAKPLNNTPLPGKLDWKRFLGSAPTTRPGADACPLLEILQRFRGREHDGSGHAPDGCRIVVHGLSAARNRLWHTATSPR